MGQNQSAEKSSSRNMTPQSDRDRRVNRRISVQALSAAPGRALPAGVSASNVAAKGTTSHAERDATQLERMLQSTSPELSSKSASSSVEKSSSRRKRDADARMTPHVPMPSSTAAIGSIDIPTQSTLPSRNRSDELEVSGRAYEERAYAPISHHRPPRLPLPIAESQMPDSPSLGPVDKNDSDIPLFDTDVAALVDVTGLPVRRNSMLSVATQDEDDVAEELQPFGASYTGETVPYTIEWNKPAERVFVTGTFAAWDKKYRLRRSESGDRFKTVINLPPGTHHLKFFVDNQMVTSPDLPTAVDFNNILVNYIEISTDDIPKGQGRRESTQVPQKVPPVHASPRPENQEQQDQHSGTATPGEEDQASEIDLLPEEMPEGDFRQVAPQALQDIDAPEDDPRYQRAARIIQEGPAPPSLPLFLSKSILNLSTNLPIKDDSSVLSLPNHTVLNHLMTSNVRNGVLATSVTTRYRKKYVTTISFKPVPRAQAT